MFHNDSSDQLFSFFFSFLGDIPTNTSTDMLFSDSTLSKIVSVDDLETAPSIPKRDFFAQKFLSSESFSHFIRVISLPLTECNNITLPKIARKRNKLPDTLSPI